MFELPKLFGAGERSIDSMPKDLREAILAAICSGISRRDILRRVQNEMVERGYQRDSFRCREVAQFLNIPLEEPGNGPHGPMLQRTE